MTRILTKDFLEKYAILVIIHGEALEPHVDFKFAPNLRERTVLDQSKDVFNNQMPGVFQ